MIEILLVGNILLLGYAIYRIHAIQDELNLIEKWADTVDEFMDSEFIELDIEVE